MAASFFEELLQAPDRDECPGAGRMISFHGDEDPQELAQLEEHASALVQLERRGIQHGGLAEFEALPWELEPTALHPALEARWLSAKPIVLHELCTPLAEGVAMQRHELFRTLGKAQGLRAFLEESSGSLAPEFLVASDRAGFHDPSRDLACVHIEASPRRDEPRPYSGPPWAKTSSLSTHKLDRSLRLRLGFGEEGEDDACRDPARLHQVQRLASTLFPETKVLHGHARLNELLTGYLGSEPLYSQHIAYWNAPQGGALFHHDAFDEDPEGGQRAVLYAQQSGWTAWLALSIDDLARRVMEFMEYLAEEELASLRERLFASSEDFEKALRWCGPGRFARLRRELAAPGQGLLGALVNCGPEFTGLLADAGHAFLLGPGDGILLPNHGYAATCMHSVFCAGSEVAFGLSLAVRASALADLRPRPSAQPSRGRSPRRRRRRSRRR